MAFYPETKKKNGSIPFRTALVVFVVFCKTAFCVGVSAQENFSLRLVTLDKDTNFLENYSFPQQFPDTLALVRELRQLLGALHADAYLEASVDTLVRQDSLFLALLHVGPPYRWLELRNGNIEAGLLQRAGYREASFAGRIFSRRELLRLQRAILREAENSGYPFSELGLRDIRIKGNQISAALYLERRERIFFGPMRLEPDSLVEAVYLARYLGIQPGQPYDRELVVQSRERLRDLPFLDLARPPRVQFSGREAQLDLALRSRQASRFDFLIGLLPNNSQTDGVLITGSFEGELLNQFSRGERLYARFEQLRPQTQQLDLAFNYPYILGTAVGGDFQFNLYKRDTSFLDVKLDLGLQYYFTGNNYLKVFWRNYSSTLLTVDEDRLLNTRRLPDQLDVSNTSFGLEWLQQQLDYRFNPRRGWSLFLRGGAGRKRIERNLDIEELDLGFLYDSLDLQSFQYQLDARLAGFIPLFRQSTLKIGVEGGFLISDGDIYQNEQYRIGGNKRLRGFDEEFFNATRYTLGTLEYRLLTGRNSYLYLFGDYAWLQDQTARRNDTLFPYGFGAGITLETPAGLFGLSLAYGGQGGAPIDFSSPKIHFGYVNRF